MHCGHVFEKPYDRQPEVEGTSGRVVLQRPHCGLLSVFVEQAQEN
jgi:hypothetical protein